MILLLVASLGAAPQWATQMHLKPKPADNQLTGISSDVVVMPAKRKATMEVTGPGTLRVQAWGLMKKSGRNLSSPGSLRVWVGTVRRQTLELPNKALDGASVTGKPRWRVGEMAEVTFPISEGTHKVSILHQTTRGAVGYALLVQVDAPTSEPSEPQPDLAASNAGETPPVAEDAGEPSLVEAEPQTAQASEPDLVGDEPSLAGGDATQPEPQEEPGLVASPLAMTAEEPGLKIIGNPKRHMVSAANKSNEYVQMTIDPGLAVEVVGPGTVLLTVHAHRSAEQVQTLEPVVFGILLDDVLVQTLALDQPASDRIRAQDASYELSLPVAVRVPVPVGTHKLQLSLSDTAVLGASVRPDFVAIGDEEPPVLGIDAALPSHLGATSPPGGISLALLGGTWAPNAFTEVGGAGLLEANFAMPISSSRLLIHLAAGFGMADATRQVADANVPDGKSRVRLELTTIPVLIGATWSAPTPAPKLFLEIGAAGGAMLTWTKTRYRRVDDDSGVGVTPAWSVHAGAGYQVGPGCVLARFYVTTGVPWSSDNIDGFDPGAVLAAVGYRLEL